MKKLMFIFGTRPEFIKMYPIIIEARVQGNEVIVVNTGQHLEMLDDLIAYFDINVDYDLEIMKKCNGLVDILSYALQGLDRIVKKSSPDLILVHGDTSTTVAGALAAFYNNVEFAHVEAGLRTYNLQSPFPEEANRQMVGVIAKYHFAPTENSRHNLVTEGKNLNDIYVVGNTAIDMLKYTIKPTYSHEVLNWRKDKKLILMTAHRRENIGELEEMFKAVNTIAEKYKDYYKVVYPIHMNPVIRAKAQVFLTSDNIRIIEPLDPVNFHNMMNQAYIILTDSGGIQEEAPSLGVPVLVLRETTERPEGVSAGTLKLVGTGYQAIVDAVDELLLDEDKYLQMSGAKNPFGQGDAAEQILNIINKK